MSRAGFDDHPYYVADGAISHICQRPSLQFLQGSSPLARLALGQSGDIYRISVGQASAPASSHLPLRGKAGAEARPAVSCERLEQKDPEIAFVGTQSLPPIAPGIALWRMADVAVLCNSKAPV